ncbi:multiple epidermal growth factor-like domains protein 9 isoform X1 [Grus americana]|uniref:multiple epidermal growth factor-like domains protein 9 isoform X1 n=1 Tax=Grus americana TaxID=9117 RepID=UPI002407F8DB|nr:multiple epidermal growth factor-like domains protein 9 isoform X1 [Grus americana]
MSAWPSPLLWSLTTACLTGIALGQTTATQAPVASTPVPPRATTTQVPIASTPAPPSATTTTASAPPTASATLSAGVTSTTANLVTSTAEPSADPSTKNPAQTLPATTDVTVLTSGSMTASQAPTGQMSVSTSTPVSPPGMTMSPGVPSAAPFLTTAKPSNCSRVNVTACARCSPGTFPNEGTSSCSCCAEGSCTDASACTSCPLGHYQPESGQPSCLPCPQGSYANLTRSTICLPCLPGHYANESGAAACRACEKGYFSSQQNAVFCLPCLPGSFCNTTSCTGCLPCPGGQEALQEASEECTPCLPGMFKGPSDNKCKLCRTGEYQLQRGMETCDLCPENHYCPSPDVNPVKCPPDAFCPAGSAEPTYCMEVFLYKVGDSCQLTPLMVVLLAAFSAGKYMSSLSSGKTRHPSAAGHLRALPTLFSGWCILCFWKPGFLIKVFLAACNAMIILSPFVSRDIAVFALKEGWHNTECLLFVLRKQVCVWTPKPGISWLPQK